MDYDYWHQPMLQDVGSTRRFSLLDARSCPRGSTGDALPVYSFAHFLLSCPLMARGGQHVMGLCITLNSGTLGNITKT